MTPVLFCKETHLTVRHFSVSIATEYEYALKFSQIRCKHITCVIFLGYLFKDKSSSFAFPPYLLDYNSGVMTGGPAANLSHG